MMLASKRVPYLKPLPTVERQAETNIRTELGTFRFYGFVDQEGREHMAVVKGDVRGADVLCRLHSECMTSEVFHSRRCECGPQLDLALKRIERAGRGVVVYLRQEGRGIGLINKLKAYALQNEGVDTLDANLALGFPGDLRRYDVAADMLRDLGVESVVLMSNNPDKQEQLKKFGIPVARRVPHVTGVNEDNREYMRTKSSRMGHIYPLALD
ncbi:MAG: GTP cyclohydrolase II [Deltaproteobacteria bacterium]|nr:GTP cyclohydrolase II [Deltaproteobacteria bacterium]